MTLVDTSAWIEYLRDDKSDVGERVQRLMNDGEAAWCDIVALELFNGCRFDQKRKLERVANTVPCLETDDSIWKDSLHLAVAARAAGVTAPTIDVLIAACARAHGVGIEHKGDDHFRQLSTIQF